VPKNPIAADPMLERLKPFYMSGADSKTIDNLVAGMASLGVGKETLLKLAQEGQVESFPLARPSSNNAYTGVNFYLDELGQAKGLDMNTRAAALADYCGFKQCPLRGDIIIARYQLVPSADGGRMYTIADFNEKELDSSSPWVKGCEVDNFEFGRQTGQVTMDQEAATNAVNSKPSFISSLSGGTEDSPSQGVAAGIASDTSIPHIEYEEKADFSIDATVDIMSLVMSTAESKGVTFDTPPVFSKKSIAVSIKSRSILIGVKLTTPPNFTALLDIPLAGMIQPDECSWTFVDGKCDKVEIYLEKCDNKMWGRLKAD